MSKQKNSIDGIIKQLSNPGFVQRSLGELKQAWWLFKQSDVPILTKLIPIVAALYVVMPVDVIPDFIPALGQADDIAFVMLGIRAFLHLSPPEVVGRYEAENGIPTIIDQKPEDSKKANA